MVHRVRKAAAVPYAAVAILVSGIIGLRADVAGQQDTVAVRYPFLVSGALTHARVAELPDGVVAKSGEITVTNSDLEQAVEQAPYFARDGLKRDPIPLLEQQLAERLLAALAREGASETGVKIPDDEVELLRRTINSIVGDVEPSETDLRAFYDENRDACGGLPFEQVKGYVARIVTERLQRERIDEFVRDLGLERPIEVSSSWLTSHAAAALDNRVDRLRGKGKPVLAVFSAASCCGSDKMKPVLEQVEGAIGEDVEIVYVEARSDQALAIRHRVSGIPTSLLFDAAGSECYRHQGALSADALLDLLRGFVPVGHAQ